MELPDFLIIPSILIKDRSLQPLDREVYGIIYWYSRLKLQKCTLSNQSIAELLGCKMQSIKNALGRLKKKKYITVVMNGNIRLELIPSLSFTPPNLIHKQVLNKVPRGTQISTPPYSYEYPNKNIYNNNITSYEVIGQKPIFSPKKKFGNQEIDEIIKTFEKQKGQIPADSKPRFIAQNIRTLIHGFLKRNAYSYQVIHHKPLSFTYTIEKSWDWLNQKEYVDFIEKLETYKLKLRVFLDIQEKKIVIERGKYDEKQRIGAEN